MTCVHRQINNKHKNKMEVVSRCLCTVFLVLTLVCESVTGTYCHNAFSGLQYYCGDDYECCHLDECCYTHYVYRLWWFWFILLIILSLIGCCITAMRRRRNRLQYTQVAQPVYGTTTHPPPGGAYQYPQPALSAPANPPPYTQPRKPPTYQ
ncbi:WW domain binding protein VOPP1 isoform X1 [Magallana gigas]|uniref:WW domain binding protein VOPP1 isoform X1 n=1 Tax=Magallana gigas TaxID=29159 RepID=UPI0033405EE5